MTRAYEPGMGVPYRTQGGCSRSRTIGSGRIERARLALVSAALVLSLSGIHEAKAAVWVTNGPLATARQNHTATLLANGKLLVAGGYNGTYLSSAELYDPATGSWMATGSLNAARENHTATLLPNGKVLVAGGDISSGGQELPTTELYDPATGMWTVSGALVHARFHHTATLLLDGQVLVAGGYNGPSAQASAELYDPASGTWTATGPMTTNRVYHTATLLPNGQVLVAGGAGSIVPPNDLPSAELYDPAVGTWTATGLLNNARDSHTATLLPDGKVLITGGRLNFFTHADLIASTELYDPATWQWTTTGTLKAARTYHTATLLPNGQALITGGIGTTGYLPGTELYNPGTGAWTTNASLNAARGFHTASLLPSGQVLVAGGWHPGYLSSTEVYDSANGTWTATGGMITRRGHHTATLLSSGKVLVAGGSPSTTVSNRVEIYDPASKTWTTTSPLTAARYDHTATLLPSGKVLVAGGYYYGGTGFSLASAEVFDPASETWTMTGALTNTRSSHTATLLPNGKVLVTGGYYYNALGSGYLSSAEVFDPATEAWTQTGGLITPRAHHTATLLPNGKVLVAGGDNSSGVISSAELYDPATGKWTPTGALNAARFEHTATLLPNGKVLVVAADGTGISAECYDPATGKWTATGSLHTIRWAQTATLLPSGKVLVAGGEGDNLQPLFGAELFDPAIGTWTVISMMTSQRAYQTANLLPDGKVLVAGGNTSLGNSAELYDVGLGFNTSWQPQIATGTSPLSFGASLAVTGSGFRGVSEGSCGNSQDSPADYPLVQLHSLESGQTLFLLSTNWQTNSFTSTPVWGFPPGYALVMVFVNGIPSTGAVVNISVPAPTTMTLTSATRLTNGAFQFAFTNAVGALFGVLATTNPALPLSNWAALGGVTEVFPGQFQFTDAQATNSPQRFYRIRSP